LPEIEVFLNSTLFFPWNSVFYGTLYFFLGHVILQTHIFFPGTLYSSLGHVILPLDTIFFPGTLYSSP